MRNRYCTWTLGGVCTDTHVIFTTMCGKYYTFPLWQLDEYAVMNFCNNCGKPIIFDKEIDLSDYAMRTKSNMTPAQERIAHYVAKGMSNEEIADELSLHVHTIETHIYRIMKKQKFSNRTELAIWWIKNFES